MSYSTNSNDSNYVVQGTVPPVAEAVEPVRRPWWPWLLLLLLIPLLWLLFRGCREECRALPTNVWTTAAQTTAYNDVAGWIPAGTEQATVTNALRTLCNYRLEHVATNAAGNWWDGNRVANAFTGIAGFDSGYVTNLQNYVNTATWCRCS